MAAAAQDKKNRPDRLFFFSVVATVLTIIGIVASLYFSVWPVGYTYTTLINGSRCDFGITSADLPTEPESVLYYFLKNGAVTNVTKDITSSRLSPVEAKVTANYKGARCLMLQNPTERVEIPIQPYDLYIITAVFGINAVTGWSLIFTRKKQQAV